MDEVPKTPAWEPAAIILAVLALIPKIYAPHWAVSDVLVSDVLMYAALAVMVIVLVRKVRRFQGLWNKDKKD